MPKTNDQRRHWLRLPDWPELDRTLWLARTGPCDDLDIPEYGQQLKPISLVQIEKGYGRYLNYLKGCGELDPNSSPEARVVPRLLSGYLRHLRDLNYMRQTFVLAISRLRSALHIMVPDYDSAWLWKPNGVPLSRWLRGGRKTFDVPHTAVLYQWGMGLMDEASQLSPRRRLAAYRDGLMIALLAARPLRRQTWTDLRIGKHLVNEDRKWRLRLEPVDMKNERALEFDLPESLGPRIDTYLKEIRPFLLRGTETDALWVAAYGHPMALNATGMMIRVRSKKRFGVPFGPHRFRHALGTTAGTVDPTRPGVAASILGVGSGMVEKHYNRADNHVAAVTHHDALDAERAHLEPLAYQLFKSQADDSAGGC